MPFGDTDAAGVVFYANYYRWFDRMSHELFRSIGQPLDHYLSGARQAPVLAETHCRFLGSLHYDDLPLLTATATEVRNRSFRIEHEVRLVDDVVAVGYEVRVWVDLSDEGVKPVPIPEPLRLALICPD